MDSFAYDGNLAQLAYEDTDEYLRLLAPYYELVVDDYDKMIVMNGVQHRLNSDNFVIKAGSLYPHDRTAFALDALLCTGIVNMEALTMTLALGADPNLSASFGSAPVGLIVQAGYGAWDAVEHVLCCGFTSLPRDLDTYAEILGTEKAEVFKNELEMRVKFHWTRNLAALFLSDDVFAIFNRIRRRAIASEDLFSPDGNTGKNFLDLLLILPQCPALFHELSLALDFNIWDHMKFPWDRQSTACGEPSTASTSSGTCEFREKLLPSVDSWTKAFRDKVRNMIVEKEAQNSSLKRMLEALNCAEKSRDEDKEDQAKPDDDSESPWVFDEYNDDDILGSKLHT